MERKREETRNWMNIDSLDQSGEQKELQRISSRLNYMNY